MDLATGRWLKDYLVSGCLSAGSICRTWPLLGGRLLSDGGDCDNWASSGPPHGIRTLIEQAGKCVGEISPSGDCVLKTARPPAAQQPKARLYMVSASQLTAALVSLKTAFFISRFDKKVLSTQSCR
jgi:hypothetical protein